MEVWWSEADGCLCWMKDGDFGPSYSRIDQSIGNKLGEEEFTAGFSFPSSDRNKNPVPCMRQLSDHHKDRGQAVWAA